MIELLWPLALLLAPLPLLVRLYWPPQQQRQAALVVPDLDRFRLREPPGLTRPGPRLRWRIALLWMIWLLLVAASARPQWTGDPVALPTSGRDLILAVDLSGSMGTEDMTLGDQPATRYAAMQAVLGDFIGRRQGDRVGLILFGTSAYLQAPLTFDLVTVQRLLRDAPIGIAGGRTAIGDAIGLAVKRLQQRPAAERVLVLFTDGASNSGALTPERAAELAQLEGVRIHTIAFGADAMRMPSLFGGFSSNLINPSSDMDEEAMEYVAATTGGRFFRARDTAGLREVYELIDAMEPIEQDPATFRPVAALYHWPLGGAWLLACLLIGIPTRGPADA